MRKVFKISFSVFVLFFLLGYYSCSTSSFFYYPDKKISHYPDTSGCNYEEVNFKSANGSILNGWFIKPKSDTVKITATVLFLHGNGGNIGYQCAPLVTLVKGGFQGLVFDYQGYGKSEGEPSQEKILEDALSAYQFISHREEVKNTKLILFGQSLGGHLACVAGAKLNDKIDAFVIEGAFSAHEEIAVYHGKKSYHAPGFLTRMFVPSEYDGIDYIDKITVPKLIIHSSEDVVCPFFMGNELFNKAKDPKQFWEIKGAHIACCRLYSDEFVKKFIDLISQK